MEGRIGPRQATPLPNPSIKKTDADNRTRNELNIPQAPRQPAADRPFQRAAGRSQPYPVIQAHSTPPRPARLEPQHEQPFSVSSAADLGIPAQPIIEEYFLRLYRESRARVDELRSSLSNVQRQLLAAEVRKSYNKNLLTEIRKDEHVAAIEYFCRGKNAEAAQRLEAGEGRGS